MRTRTVISALLCLMVGASHVSAQRGVAWSRQERTFTFTDENDVFGGTSDSSYTQGLRAAWEFAAWNPNWNTTVRDMAFLPVFEWALRKHFAAPKRACTPRMPRSMLPCGTVGFSVGQTQYTPPDIITSAVQPNARPYAGYLFGAFTRTMVFSGGAVSSELQAGVVGPLSLGQDGQSFAHWTWSAGSAQPQGWRHQLKNMPHVSLVNLYALRVGEYCSGPNQCDGTYAEQRWFDATARLETTIGTLMDRASLGQTIRVGYGFPALTGPQRIPVTKAFGARDQDPARWGYVFLTTDQRFVAYNALLTGSIPDSDWRRQSRIRTDHVFGEYALGFALGYRRFSAMYQYVTRESEYKPFGGLHRFGSVSLAFHASQVASR